MSTPNLDMPTVTTNILSPDLPVNEALLIIDAFATHTVVDKDLNTPPTTTDADAGKMWIIGPSPTGRWDVPTVSEAGWLAIWRGADSEYYVEPKEGWEVYITDEDLTYRFNGSAWVDTSGGGADANTVSVLTTSSGVVNIDLSLGDYFTLALSANVTSVTFSNLPGSGKGASKFVRITQDSTPRTLAWPASFRWEGSAPSVSTGSGAVDVLAISTFDNGTKWDATLSKGRV